MEANLFQKAYSHPSLNTKDVQEIADAHQKINFNKGELVLECGQTANDYYLIEQGLFRAFVHDYNGNQITTDFCGTGQFLIEVSSLFQRVPTKENMVAMTYGIAWKIKYGDFQELFHRIEGFREWGRAWMSDQLFISKQRSLDQFTKSATERYLMLVKDRPQIITHAPLKHIASYLRITDTSLSRIRKEIALQ